MTGPPIQPPTDPTNPVGPSPAPALETYLMQHANDAIQAGKDPRAVTQRLGQIAAYLQSNPDIATQGEAALKAGKDPAAVAGRVWQLTQKAPAIPPGPGGRDYSAPSASGKIAGNIDLRTANVPGVVAESTGVRSGGGKAPEASNPIEAIEGAPIALFKGATLGTAPYIAGAVSALAHPNDMARSFDTARQEWEAGQEGYAQQHPYANVTGQVVGGFIPGAAAAPLGIVKGGALLGGISGAAAPAASLGERVLHTGVGGVTGAATGAILKGLGNLADRTGVTDLVAKGLSKINPDLGAAIGTRGQINDVLADRQDILNAIGDNGDTGAQQQLERIAATRATAKQLYDAARADQGPIQNARLQELLSDPRIAKSYSSIVGTLDQSGNPLPTPSANTILSQRSNGLLSPEDVSAASSAFDRAYGKPGAPTTALPDPRALSLLKRELYNIAQGKLESPIPLKQEEAQQLLPMVDEIRAQLHAASPAWRNADAFYSQAKGEEEAFANGYDAFRNAANPSGDQLPEKSLEAMHQAITEPRFLSEPPAAMAARADAFRQGMRAAAGDQLRNAPVDKNLRSILGVNAFAPTQASQQTRSVMFTNPSDAQSLESLLSDMRGGSLAHGGSMGTAPIPASRTGVLRSLVKILQEPNLLNTPKGQSLLMERFDDPSFLSQEIAASRGAGLSLKDLLQAGTIGAAGNITGAAFGPGKAQ